MKKKHFYSHLIDIESIIIKLDSMHFSFKEREELENILHSSLHTAILDKILSELQEEDKKLFLEAVYQGNHRYIWEFIHKRSINVDKKIKKIAKELIKEFDNDISEIKRKKTDTPQPT
jgi:hypothetical protein